MKGRLVLVDGSSYLYRSFYALPPLKTTHGESSGAIYGVVAMLKKLQRELASDDVIAVVFDSPTPTFRHTLYPDYKAHRLKMPEELQAQIPAIHAIIPAMGFPLILHPGVEADDIIGTLVHQAETLGLSAIISTNDKDFAQLVTSSTSLLNPLTGVMLDEKGVLERFGVLPSQMIDYFSLIGDVSDNVPGIPLVGPKTALKWLKQYHTLDNLLSNASCMTGKIGDNLRNYRDQVLLARTLITIKCDVPIVTSLDQITQKAHQTDIDTLQKWFERLEFTQWSRELSTKETVRYQMPTHYDVITDQPMLDHWLKEIALADYLVLDLETTSLDNLNAEIVGIGLGLSLQKVAYIPLQHDYIGCPKQLNRRDVLAKLKTVLEDDTLKKIGHNLKYDLGVLANYTIELKGLYADTLLEAYLLDSTHKHNNLDNLAFTYLDHKTITFESIAGEGKKAVSFNQIELDKAAPYTIEDVSVCLALHNVLEPRLNASCSLVVRDTLEMPLVPVLSRMERKGVQVNAELLHEQSQVLEERLVQLERKTHDLAGQVFNLGSPQQLQTILYDRHHLPVLAKTTKGKPSTSERTLKMLASHNPLPQLVLEYRTLSKLKSTYTDSLPKQLHPKTNRIHTAYHQAVVATGRLSSSNPNLQNIPIRTKEGRNIRRAFEAPPGYKLVSADYSQIELRIMAHLSNDRDLLEALQAGQDVHAATAARLFGVSVDNVSQEERRRAKAINFGLMYGMSAFGLATQLQTTPELAKEIIEQYFKRYPGVRQYMDRTRQLAHQSGYVTTYFGRRLQLPSLKSSNKRYQKAAERAAINAPLQGTAADIVKRAMIDIDAALTQHAIDATMVMQVHDELVFEVNEEALKKAIPCIVEGMQNAATLKVPLSVSIGVGDNWNDAH